MENFPRRVCTHTNVCSAFSNFLETPDSNFANPTAHHAPNPTRKSNLLENMKNLAAFLGLCCLFMASSLADHHLLLAAVLVVSGAILVMPSWTTTS